MTTKLKPSPVRNLVYNIVYNDQVASSITVFVGSDQYVAVKDHPNFQKIIDAVQSSESRDNADEIIKLFDLAHAVSDKFARLSERVLINGGQVLFDGEPQHGALIDAIVGFYKQGLPDWMPLVNFMEKVSLNPSENSRKQLYSWLERNAFSLTPDGDIIAYKGVHRDGEGKYLSSSSGSAFVNGVLVKGRIPTSPNTIVEMPRSEVVDDPHNACSTGLHAGDWSYASTFAQVTLYVVINPRDVVSVPRDSSYRKMRVCRYRVLGEAINNEELKLIQLDGDAFRTRYLGNRFPEAQQDVEPVTPAAKKKSAKPKVPRKKFYEDFTKADFVLLPYNELRWLAREWEAKIKGTKKDDLVAGLARAASNRRRKNLKPRDKVKIR